MNRLIIVLISLLSLTGVRAQNSTPGQWRLHNTWDYYPGYVIDTPNRTYYLMNGHGYVANTSGWAEESKQLFTFDKETGELQEYNAANYLHGNIIQHAAYNAQKGYLLIVYQDYNIDLLYDDDTLYSVPGLASATLTSAKDVNNVTFDADNNRAYLATAFGYMVIDDKNYVIDESHVYNIALTGIARVGNRLVASTTTGIYSSPIDIRHNTWDTFTPIEGIQGGADCIMPLNDSQFGFSQSGVHIGTVNVDGTGESKKLYNDSMQHFSANKQGYFFLNNWQVGQFFKDGTSKRYNVPENLRGKKSGSWDFVTLYSSLDRNGYVVNRYNADSKEWTETLNSPSDKMQPYKIFHIDFSPAYGVMAANESFNRFLAPAWVNNRHLISFYKDGKWTSIGGSTQPSSPYQNYNRNGYGPVIDPMDGNLLWAGSFSGLFRFKMPEGTMSLYTYPNGPGKGNEGFHSVFPQLTGGLADCQIGLPAFDADGNMWVMQNIKGSNLSGYSPLYCWPAADRLADNISTFKSVPVKGYQPFGSTGAVYAMKHSTNRNIVIFNHPTEWGGGIYILNHGGTINDTADDKMVYLNRFIDQNGTSFSTVYINCMYEDPETGVVWVGCSTGTFTFRPTDILGGQTTVNRIIVSRNDGTGQGDYLLNGIDVYHINADGAGRKWFSSIGNGIYIVSKNGDEIIDHITTDNSLLPSNDVYITAFDPNSNAAWIGTHHQLATYYTEVTPGESTFDNVVSYPNPVKPDFYGEVTIQGLMDDSLIKIIDQGGNLVKELGRTQGGMITWDLTNLEGRRVGTGVYIIAASNEQTSSASVGKILVVK